MAILVYWRYDNYISDTEKGFAFHFNSSQQRLHEMTQEGDDVFAVTGVRTNEGFNIYLLAHLVIKAKTFNAPDYEYGKFRIWGDTEKSRYFETNESMTSLLRDLDSVRHFDDKDIHKYSQAFQTIRYISSHDTALILEFAKKLKVNPKTFYNFPEKEFEESLNTRHEAEKIINAETNISDSAKQFYLKKTGRNQSFSRKLNDTYAGKCQLCAFDPMLLYGKPLCVAHHIIYISRGGEDAMSNMILVCPNCHEAIHKTDAAFDYKDLTYKFDSGRTLPLVINNHLKYSQQ